MLGGSSGINFMTYTHPCAQDLDDWVTELGLEGWSFTELLPYFQRHQDLKKDLKNISERDATVSALDINFHGTGGPIHTSLPTWHVPFEKPLLGALDQESGLPRSNEPNNGEHIAFFKSFLSDRTGKPVHSNAANGYLAPVMKRPNLRVITETIVTRVDLEQDATRRLYVKGVELLHDKIPHNIFVKKKKLF